MLTKEVLIPTEVFEKINAINLEIKERKEIDREFLFYLMYLEQKLGAEEDDNGFNWIKASSSWLQLKRWNYQEHLKLLDAEKIIKRSHKYKLSTRGNKGYPKSFRLLLKKKPIYIFDLLDITKEKEIDHTSVIFTDNYFDELKPKVNKQITILEEDLSIDPKIYKLKKSLENRVAKREIKKGYIDKIFEPINKLKDKDTGGTLGRTNRLFQTFGRVTSGLRYYLEIEKEKMVEMDLANSQMFFLFLLIKMYNPELLEFEDVRDYGDLVIDGEIYEHLVKLYNKMFPEIGMTRSIIKKTVLQAFFSKEFEKSGKINRYRKNTRLVIKKAFPNLYNYIVETKKDNFKTLSRKLQRMESDIFVDKLFEQAGNYKYLTVHDALYCKQSDMETMEKKLRDIFKNEYGITPNMKKNILNKQTVKQTIAGIKDKKRIKELLRKQKL